MLSIKQPEDFFSNHEVGVEIASPLHVGGASEKHWVKNIDFIYQDNCLFPIDNKKLIQEITNKGIDINVFSDWIASDLEKLPEHLKKNGIEVSTISNMDMIQCLDGEPEQSTAIKTFFRNGLGKIVLPGSSIKGALRSILWHHIYSKYKPKITNNGMIDKDFGDIENNLMRFLRIGDVSFENKSVQLYKTKIMSRRDEDIISWKHKKEGSEINLDEHTFVTFYECLQPNAFSTLRINFSKGIKDLNSSESIKNVQYLFPNEDDLLIALFKKINEYAKEHIKREIQFLRHKATPESNIIVKHLQNLINKIPENNRSALLRMASGVGFHNITGDWKEKDHTKTLQYQEKFRKKTRRTLLIPNSSSLDLDFMGFVWLHHPESVSEARTNADKSIQKQIEYNEAKVKPIKDKIEKEKKMAEDKKIPKYHQGALRRNLELDAQYIGNIGGTKQKKFKILAGEEGKEPIVNLTYAADLDLNSFHRVQINSIQGQKIQSISYINKK